VVSATVERLGWTSNFNPANSIATLPATSLANLIQWSRDRLGIDKVRYIGELAQSCKKILLMPGAAGGTRQIQAMGKEKPDVLICGEIQEWETAEYVRDAQAKGEKLSLIVLGHIASEGRPVDSAAVDLGGDVVLTGSLHLQRLEFHRVLPR